MLLVALIAVAVVGLASVVGGLIMTRQSSGGLLEERLGIPEERARGRRTGDGRTAPLTDALDRALTERGIGANLATQLARADLKLTVGEYLALMTIVIVGAGVLSYLWRRDIIISAGACLAGFFGLRLYVAARRGRRLRAFNGQLGDTIGLMVNSIRAGYSILQAMKAVADEMDAPISEEFARVFQEVQLGIPLEQALGHMLRRVPSDDLDMMITAINVQREVGGNLAEVLDTISFTIRERIRIKGEIQALTAQSRYSGYTIATIPVILTGVIYVINPGFMNLLLQHTCGHIMIVVAVVGIILGFLVIRKVVDIDI
jgi:tight adherence protein B